MNVLEPLVHTLRDGRAVTIRQAGPDDIDGLVQLDAAVVADGRGVMRGPDDAGEASRRRFAGQVEQLADVLAGTFLVAVDDAGAVLGEASARRVGNEWSRHVAFVALSVRPDAQGVGLGRALMERLLDWGRATDPPIERMGLVTRADNDRAIGLYRSLGFEHEGVRRKMAKLPDGSYLDDVVMGLLL